jgi:hypothetical protein
MLDLFQSGRIPRYHCTNVDNTEKAYDNGCICLAPNGDNWWAPVIKITNHRLGKNKQLPTRRGIAFS